MQIFREKFSPKVKVPQIFSVLGVGGVGSNAVRAIHLNYDKQRTVHMYDNDTIEYHNLNRLYLPLNTIGRTKVDAIYNNIRVMAPCYTQSTRNHIQNVSVTEDSIINTEGVVIDCRDTIADMFMHKDAWMKTAYDGGSDVSFTLRPKSALRGILNLTDDDNTYRVTPSFVVPAVLLANVSVYLSMFPKIRDIADSQGGTTHFNIDDLQRSLTRSVTL